MHRLISLLFAALALGFAPAPFLTPRNASPEEDLKALQGVWVRVNHVVNGVASQEAPGSFEQVIVGGRMTFRRGNGELFAEYTLALDPSTRPRTIDTTILGTKQVLPGIYRIDGDGRTVCWSIGSEPRPTTFQARKGVCVSVFKRKKP